jgi:hypothetical protein
VSKVSLCAYDYCWPASFRASAGSDRSWFAYSILFLLSAFEAYAVAGVPVQYLAAFAACFVVMLLRARYGPIAIQNFRLLFVYFLWAAGITALSCALHDYSDEMPPLSTTSYAVYIGLRFLNILSFAAMVWLITFVGRRRGLRPVVERAVEIAALIALVGFYLYYASLAGLPEPPRTRIGTQGGEQILLSSYYAFHRALGTFREPSHFAEWLAPTFCLAFLHRGFRRIICLVLIGTVLLLTGSLTGILGFAGSVVAAAIIVYRGRVSAVKMLALVALAVAITMSLFAASVKTYNRRDAAEQNRNILEVVMNRVQPLLSEGMEGSNRAYVYNYLRSAPTPILGAGIGNAELEFAQAVGSPLPGSFLSIYFNTYYSLGPIGVGLLATFLLVPVARAALRPFNQRKSLFWILASYVAVLISLGVRCDEFNTMTALIFSALSLGIDFACNAGRVGQVPTPLGAIRVRSHPSPFRQAPKPASLPRRQIT